MLIEGEMGVYKMIINDYYYGSSLVIRLIKLWLRVEK